MFPFKRFPLKTNMTEVARTVKSLRSLWKQRLPNLPFYTLGAAVYLDVQRDKSMHRYLKMAANLNSVIAANFLPLLEEVDNVLEKELRCKTQYEPKYGIPGFHIFEQHAEFEVNGGVWHIDTPQNELGLPDNDPISFTVAVELPLHGGGMYMRESNYCPIEEVEYIAYKVGEMILHDGKVIHRIAPVIEMQENDMRITLQGHGVKVHDKYVIFW